MNEHRLFLTIVTTAMATIALTASAAKALDSTWDHDANGTASDGPGIWTGPNQWLTGGSGTWNNGDNAQIGSGGDAGVGSAIDLIGDPIANNVRFSNYTGTYRLENGVLTVNGTLEVGADAGYVQFRSTAGLAGTGNIVLNGPYPTERNGPGVLDIRLIPGSDFSLTGDVAINNGVMLVLLSRPSGNISLNGGANQDEGAVLESYWGYTTDQNLGSNAGEIQVIGGRSGFSGQGANGQRVRLTDPTLAPQTVRWGTPFFNPSVLILQSPNASNAGNVIFDTSIDLNGADRTISVDKEHDLHWDSTSNTDLRGRAGIFKPVFNTSGTAAGIIKEGPGRLELNAVNTYDGNTTVNAGILQYSQAAAMPSTGITTFNTGTELWVEVGGSGEFTPDNAGAGSLGGLLAGTGNGGSQVVYNGDVELTVVVNSSSVDVSADIPNLGGDGTTTNVMLLNRNATLSGINTYTGTTRIGRRTGFPQTVTIGSAEALGGGGPVIIGSRGSSVLDLNGFDTTIGKLSTGSSNGGQRGLIVDNVGGATLTLTGGVFSDDYNNGGGGIFVDKLNLNGTEQVFEIRDSPPLGQGVGDFLITSVIENGSLTMTGLEDGASLRLEGVNTYAGNTIITAGILSINNAYLSDASEVIIDTGAVFDLDFIGTDTIRGLSLGGTAQAPGVYGAVGSGAEFETVFITGTGTLAVAVPEPSSIVLLACIGGLRFFDPRLLFLVGSCSQRGGGGRR